MTKYWYSMNAADREEGLGPVVEGMTDHGQVVTYSERGTDLIVMCAEATNDPFKGALTSGGVEVTELTKLTASSASDLIGGF
jgi:hypothetical protein